MFGAFGRKQKAAPPVEPRESAPATVGLDGGGSFDLAGHLKTTPEGFPQLDWDVVLDWVASLETDARKVEGWSGCSWGWLLHLRDSLGERYHLDGSEAAWILSSLDPRQSEMASQFIARTVKRVGHLLKDVADPGQASRVLVVFDDEDTYYRYVSQFNPDQGDFSFSSGMHINRGFSHFITTKADLRNIEPVIAHELTHACVRHLPLPLWLNEGLAVNTERQLVGGGSLVTPREMHAKHMKFWNAEIIQEFWSGDSFKRPDEGNELSYDLGRLLVEQFAMDWPRFAAFANAADYEDAGAAAAREHLGVELGTAVAAILERENSAGWAPDPKRWKKLETRTE